MIKPAAPASPSLPSLVLAAPLRAESHLGVNTGLGSIREQHMPPKSPEPGTPNLRTGMWADLSLSCSRASSAQRSKMQACRAVCQMSLATQRRLLASSPVYLPACLHPASTCQVPPGVRDLLLSPARGGMGAGAGVVLGLQTWFISQRAETTHSQDVAGVSRRGSTACSRHSSPCPGDIPASSGVKGFRSDHGTLTPPMRTEGSREEPWVQSLIS